MPYTQGLNVESLNLSPLVPPPWMRPNLRTHGTNPGPLVHLEGVNEGRGSTNKLSCKLREVKDKSVAKRCTIGAVECPGSGRTVDCRSSNG